MSVSEWDALGWDVQQVYLKGMEEDESVPLTFERRGDGEEGNVVSGLPEGFAPQARQAAPDSVIDITGMLADLEVERREGKR